MLASRLERLCADGLLTKVQYQDHPPRFEYRLTPKGRAFWDVLAAMWRWGSDWLWDEGEEPPLILADRESGAEVRPQVIDEHTGEPLDVRSLRIAEQPPGQGNHRPG